MIIYLVVIGSSMALSSTDPIFSPFMSEKFGMNAGQIGLVFMTSPAVYALVAPLCGWVSDKVRGNSSYSASTSLSRLYTSPYTKPCVCVS